MRLLIGLPEQDRATGNWSTAERFRKGLERLGHTVEVFATPLGPEILRGKLKDFVPDLTLLLHAYRSGRPWLEAEVDSPFLILLTGTDINQGMEDRNEGPVIREVLRRAGAIILQNPLLADDFRSRHPEFSERLHYLPPAVELGTEPFELRRNLGIRDDLPLFLCPAGLRPVKNQNGLLEFFSELPPSASNYHLAFCGQIIDEEYGRGFLEALNGHPRASWLGVIPPAAVPAALREADIVVNNSHAEGLPNALVEAAALGRPILARNIPGNAAVVEHGKNGLLYGDSARFTRYAIALISDPAVRHRLSRPSPERYSQAREAQTLDKILRTMSGFFPGPS